MLGAPSYKTLTLRNAYVILSAIMMHWVETHNVLQRKRGVAREGSMKTQETQEKRIVPAARGRRLDLERVKQLAVEHRPALAMLAKNDGPVPQHKDTRG